jgi:hypothetical protein
VTERSCDDVRLLAPDLALGLLTGEERAAVLAHLERCESCRAEVASLALAADEVLLASPEATPPEEFADRVLARVHAEVEMGTAAGGARERAGTGGGLLAVPGAEAGAAAPDGGTVSPAVESTRRRERWARRRHPRRADHRPRRVAVAALAAAAVAVVVAGILAVSGGGELDRAEAATADMRTGRGDVVGDATVTGADPATIVVDVPEWAAMVERWGTPEGGYWLAVEVDDGTRTVHPIPGEVDDWTVRVDGAAADVASVAMIDAEGRVWCTGEFSS